MEQNYLLTYTDNDVDKFAWFESEKYLFDFVEENNVEIIDALFIRNAESII